MSKKTYDNHIKHNIYVRGQVTRITNAMLEILKKSESDIADKITEDAFRGVRKLNSVINGVYEEVDRLYSDLTTKLEKELGSISEYQAGWMLAALSADANIRVDTSTLLSQVLSDPFDGKLLKEWVAEQSDSLKKKIRNEIRQGVIEGKSINQIVQAVRTAEQGAMKINKRQTEAMVRTAVNHTLSTADNYVYNKAKVVRYQFVSILDSRTTLICAANDGKIFEIGEKGAKRPPLHIGCRSFTIPVMDDSDVVDESYEEWLSRQKESTQRKVLGDARYKLWKAGEPLGKFVDNNEHVIPLSDLPTPNG